MNSARESRYWRSYRDSKTFTLTIYIFEAHLGFNANSYSSNGANGSFTSNGSSLHNHLHHHHHGASMDGSMSSSTGGGGGPWDTKIVVSLPNDPMGERHETSRAGKTPNPVWDQVVVFRDIDYSELVRVEMRGIRKLGDNPVLASVEFEVHDVMGLSLKDQPSVFQLESHDRSRHRYGVILLAFRFDPPVAADVFGEFDGTTAVGPVAVPRGVSAAVTMCKGEEDVVAPAWGGEGQEVGVGAGPEESPEPVYINVEGHFACLLLDDDTPPQAPSKAVSVAPSSSRSSSGSRHRPSSSSTATTTTTTTAARDHDPGASPGNSVLVHQHPRLSNGSNNSSSVGSESRMFDYEPLIHGRGSAVRMAMAGSFAGKGGGGGGAGDGSGRGAKRRSMAKDLRPRPSSLGSSLANQLSALGLGVGGGITGGGNKPGNSNGGSAVVKLGRPSSVDNTFRSSLGPGLGGRSSFDTGDTTARLEKSQHRWSLPRGLHKPHETAAGANSGGSATAGAADGNGGPADRHGRRGSSACGKRGRSWGWANGFLRSPTLGGLRARAPWSASRSRSKSTSSAAAAASVSASAIPHPAAAAAAVESEDSSCASTVRVGEEASTANNPPSVLESSSGTPPPVGYESVAAAFEASPLGNGCVVRL